MYNEENNVSEIPKYTDIHRNTSDSNKNKFTNKNATKQANKTYTYLGICWKCNECSHMAKECKSIPSDTNQTDHIIQEQTMINTYRNRLSTSPVSQIKYPITISSAKPSILTQQITADFQLSQEAWNLLSSQMDEMVEANKTLKKAIQGTYKNDKNTKTKP